MDVLVVKCNGFLFQLKYSKCLVKHHVPWCFRVGFHQMAPGHHQVLRLNCTVKYINTEAKLESDYFVGSIILNKQILSNKYCWFLAQVRTWQHN